MYFRDICRQQFLNFCCWVQDLFGLRPVCVVVDMTGVYPNAVFMKRLVEYFGQLHKRKRLSAVMLVGAKPRKRSLLSVAQLAANELKALMPEVFGETGEIGIGIVDETPNPLERTYVAMI